MFAQFLDELKVRRLFFEFTPKLDIHTTISFDHLFHLVDVLVVVTFGQVLLFIQVCVDFFLNDFDKSLDLELDKEVVMGF